MSADKDLDTAHGGAADGIHIAGRGANWQILVFGFAGMATALQADVFTLRLLPPAHWRRLAFTVVWKGQPLAVEIAAGRCAVTNRGRTGLPVCVWGERRDVPAGGTARFDAPATGMKGHR